MLYMEKVEIFLFLQFGIYGTCFIYHFAMSCMTDGLCNRSYRVVQCDERDLWNMFICHFVMSCMTGDLCYRSYRVVQCDEIDFISLHY